MKLKTRLIIAFLTVILIPVLLAVMLACLFGKYQMSAIEKTYEITGMTTENLANSVAVMSRLTEKAYNELDQMVSEHPGKMEDVTFLDEFNQKIEKKKAYLLVRKNNVLIYVGTDMEEAEPVITQLPGFGDSELSSENGLYLGGDAQALVKQVDFRYPDNKEGSAFVVVSVRCDPGGGAAVSGYGRGDDHGAGSDGGGTDLLDTSGYHGTVDEDAGGGAEDQGRQSGL